jgi:aminopeptidase N
MRTETPQSIHLKDYTSPAHLVEHAALTVRLDPAQTRIVSTLSVVPQRPGALVLDGEGLILEGLSINGEAVERQRYTYENKTLTIADVPQQPFTLQITQTCNPKANTALSGLYLSNGIYCTQMEAEGFRRFAFFPDRPDVMATFDVRIEAPSDVPVLLSNGNPGHTGALSEGWHFAEWHDPHPKPSYLFALVAGDLAHVTDHFTTMDGHDVTLGIYVEQGKQDRCAWAMTALKASMRWDEEAFGRAYDLDVFNIVAVSDFNMGAMENKGLNIFNDKYILATPETATDLDHAHVERIIAHEYFHNWTGNRITCRDWFQLCLKEGLTVFRDQEFTSDLRSRAVKRIEDVRTLRARQFPEDQGPLAHPVRPASYIEINNFYTPTVYEKGAEICRMLHTVIGAAAFRKGMDLYFQRCDGSAATVEDFVGNLAEASGRDLSAFLRWYEQAGTPIVEAEGRHDAAAQTYHLHLRQHTPATPGQSSKAPLPLPLAIGLVGPDGAAYTVPQSLLLFDRAEASFTFPNIPKAPALSLNRGFSAPIILRSNASEQDQLTLLAHDSDTFNRWEAGQSVARSLLLAMVDGLSGAGSAPDVTPFARALERVVRDTALDPAYRALMLDLPGEAEIAALIGRDVDAARVHEARTLVRRGVAEHLLPHLEPLLAATEETGPYVPDMAGTGRRSLRYAVLHLLAQADQTRGLALAAAEFDGARSMTAEMGALQASLPFEAGQALLDRFIARHADDPLLVDKWLLLSAAAPRAGAAERVQALETNPLFSWLRPNKVYALIGGLSGNFSGFHRPDGAGYRVVADAIIKVNSTNPQVAARLATGFRSWRQFNQACRAAAEAQMRRVLETPALSPDVFEIITRTLV